MLKELKEYMKQEADVSLFDLCQKFDVDPETMRAMLQELIDKGLVRKKKDVTVTCTKCAQCRKLADEIYEWI